MPSCQTYKRAWLSCADRCRLLLPLPLLAWLQWTAPPASLSLVVVVVVVVVVAVALVVLVLREVLQEVLEPDLQPRVVLPLCPFLRLDARSRHPLGLPGQELAAVPLLSEEAAVQVEVLLPLGRLVV